MILNIREVVFYHKKAKIYSENEILQLRFSFRIHPQNAAQAFSSLLFYFFIGNSSLNKSQKINGIITNDGENSILLLLIINLYSVIMRVSFKQNYSGDSGNSFGRFNLSY